MFTLGIPERMKTHSTQRVVALVLSLPLILANTGCQTFTLTREDFEKQQRGEMVDRDVGAAVGVIGSAAYFGGTIGAAVAGGK